MRRAPEEGQPSQGQPRFDADLSNHMRSLTDRAQSTMTSDDLRASKQSSKLGGNDDGGSSSGARLTPHQAASTLQSSSAATTSAIPAWHLGTGGSSYSSRGRSGGVAKRHDPDAEPMLPSEFMASMAWTSSNHTSRDNSASGSAGGGMPRVGTGGGGGGSGSASNAMRRGLMLSLTSGEGPYESWPEYKPSPLAAGPASAAASAATTIRRPADRSRPEHRSLAKSPQPGRDMSEAPIAQQQQEWDRVAAAEAREGRALPWLDRGSVGATGENPYVAVEEDMGGADGGAGIGLGAIFSTFNNNNGAAAFELGGRGGRERAEAVGSEEQEEADEVTATLVPMYVHHGGSSMGGGGGDGGGAGPLNSLSVLLMRSEGVAGLLGLGSHTPASGTNTLESLNNNSSVHNSDLFGSLMGRTGSQSSIAAAAPGPLDSLTALLLRSERERSTEAGVTGLPRPVALAGGSRGSGGGSGSGSGVMGRSSSRGGTASGNFIGRQSSNLSGKDGGGSSRPPRVAAAPASASTALRPPPPPPMRGAAASGNSGASNHGSIGKARSAVSLQGGGNDGGGSAVAAGANPRLTLSGGRSTASARPSRRAGTSTGVAKGEAQRPEAATAAATSSASGLMEGLSSFFTNMLFKGLGDGGVSAGPCSAVLPIHAGSGGDGTAAEGRGGSGGGAGGSGGSMVAGGSPAALQQPGPPPPGFLQPEAALPGSPLEAPYYCSGGRGENGGRDEGRGGSGGGGQGGGAGGGGGGGGRHGSIRGGSGSGSRLVMLDTEGRLVPVHPGGGSSGLPPHPRASAGGGGGILPHLIAPEAPQWGSAPVMAGSLPGGFGGNSGPLSHPTAPRASQWGAGAPAAAGLQPGGFGGLGGGGGGGRLLVRDAEGRLVPVALGDPSMQPSSAMLGPPTPPYFGPAAAYCAAPPPGAHQVAAPSWSGVHVALVVAVVFVVALNMAVVMYMLLLRCVKGGHHIA